MTSVSELAFWRFFRIEKIRPYAQDITKKREALQKCNKKIYLKKKIKKKKQTTPGGVAMAGRAACGRSSDVGGGGGGGSSGGRATAAVAATNASGFLNRHMKKCKFFNFLLFFKFLRIGLHAKRLYGLVRNFFLPQKHLVSKMDRFYMEIGVLTSSETNHEVCFASKCSEK